MSDSEGPVRIVHLTWATGIGGGVARMDAYLHRYLNRDLFDPMVVVLDEEKPGQVWFDESIPFRYTGVENRFEALLKFFADADIVQFQGGFDPLVCEAARASGVPALVEVIHTIEPGGLYPNIDITVCVSESVRRVQPNFEKTAVARNGIDLEEFTFAKEPRRDDKIIILQAANRDKPYFNLDEIADQILPMDPRIEIWLAGGGQTGRSSDRVKFMGLRKDIAELYRRADILALFTRKEAFGLVVVEAMASGCVPVVSCEEGPGEIVTDGVDGWTAPPADREKVVAAIGRAVKTRGSQTWERMRAAARRTVEEKFSARRSVGEYEKIYTGLIEAKGRRGKSGPLTAVPAPEVEIAEGLFHFQNSRKGMFAAAMRRLVSGSDPVKVSLCANVAQKLARQIAASGDRALASAVYRKLYDSGYRGAFWMKEWLEIIPESDPADFLVDELLALAPADPEVVMLAVEKSLNRGDVAEALKTLEEGVRSCPGSLELMEVYEALRKRLGKP